MSPSESQLRAALHEGEGQGLDAGLLIVHANRLRRERRRRINQVAGATLVVGVVGAGFGLLTGGGSNDQAGGSSGGSATVRQQASRAAGVGGGAYGSAKVVPAPASSANYSVAGSCPSVPDHIALPEGVTKDEASGPLLPRDAAAIHACGYPNGTRARTLVLRSAQASALAATLDAAPITPGRAVRSCTNDEPTGTVELLAVDSAGRRAKPVVITVVCPNAVATNGVATRYLTVAPAVLRDLLRQ